MSYSDSLAAAAKMAVALRNSPFNNPTVLRQVAVTAKVMAQFRFHQPKETAHTVAKKVPRTLNDTPITELDYQPVGTGRIYSPNHNAKRVKRQNERYEVTAKEVAADLGISRRAVEYWDSGNRPPPEGYTRRSRVAYLMFREDYKAKKALKQDAGSRKRASVIDFQEIDGFYKKPDGTQHKAGRYREQED
jgi:hypothetical protein